MIVILTVDILSETDTFTDGLWHSVSVDIESGGGDRIGKINFTVDGRPDASNRQLEFKTTDKYKIGGINYVYPLNHSFKVTYCRTANIDDG